MSDSSSRVRSYFWERAPFFRILLPFVAGILCYDRLQPYKTASASWVIITGIIALSAFGLQLIRRRTYRQAADILLLAALFFFAVSVSSFRDVRTSKDWIGFSSGQAAAWEVVVTTPPLEKEKTFKLAIAAQRAILQNGSVVKASGPAFLYIYKDSIPQNIKEGDHIIIPNKLQPIKNAGNPYEMDYTRYAARNNYYFQQFSGSNEITILNTNAHAYILKDAHNWCQQQLTRYIKDSATMGILQAMLIGDETRLDDDLRQAYSQTGVIHIISISGSHVAVFFVLISGMLWWLRHKKYTALKYVLAILPVWFYVLMAGAPPSAIRAAVMFTLLAAGYILKRNNNPFNSLAAAAFILLCIQPSWLFSVGFQLSFIAVLSLIIFYKPVTGLLKIKNKILAKLWQICAASLAAEILVAPLVIYYFHSFPAMFLIANIIAHVLTGALLIAGMALLLFAWIPLLAKCLAVLCTGITAVFNHAIILLQSFSPAALNRLNISDAELLVVYVLITLAAAWLLREKKKAILFFAGNLCLLLFLFCYDEWQALHHKTLVVYNMGKNNYAELISGKKAQVFTSDTGIRERGKYILQAAHIGFGVTETENTSFSVVALKDKKILFLKELPIPSQKFPVDMLVLLRPVKGLSFTVIHQMFHPAAIIMPSGQPAWQMQQWKDSCISHHIIFHYTAADGAYVLSN